MPTDQELPLGAEFPTPSRDQWLALVDTVLAGAPFDRKLVTATLDGLRIEPLYVDGDGPGADAAGVPGQAPFTRGSDPGRRVLEGWDVRQYHRGEDLAAANRAVLTDLERGATSVVLGPLPVDSVDDLDRLLDGVHLDLACVVLDWGPAAPRGASLLTELWDRRAVPASAALAEPGIDPLGALARHGWLHSTLDAELADMAELAAESAPRYPGVRTVRVDATPYADAGAADAEELAFALATGVAYLRTLTGAGLGVDDALSQLSFTLSATADQFATMAKLRAARRCWARVAEACGATPPAQAMKLDALTSRAMYSVRDPWVNLLRATLACFAAGAAGADSVTVLPLGEAAGWVDDLGRRLARNTHLVLLEEANLARVVDPGGGSWYLEARTEALAERAWSLFQGLESTGGMAEALRSGRAADTAAASWGARFADLVRGKAPLTGVSEFPHLDESPLPGVVPGSAAAARRAVRRPAPPDPGERLEPLPLRRAAEPFERLRDAADGAATRPSIFLANLGPVAVHTTRATFAKNLFEVAGIRAVPGAGVSTPDEAAAEWLASGTPLAVLCSSDEVYAEAAAPAARALKAAGVRRLYLAGNPGERRAELEAAGVDEFVHAGCDRFAALTGALDAAGVEVPAEED